MKRGLVCLECGVEYPTVDALIASGHWQGKPCAKAPPHLPRMRSTKCAVSDHSACGGRIPPSYGDGACRCECHEAAA